MPLEQLPIYRKTIVPWYDSDPVCVAVIIVMLALFLFAIAGIAVSGEETQYRSYIWLPLLIAGLSGSVLFSTGKRMLKRRWRHKPEELD